LALTFTNKAAGEMKQRIQSFGIPKTEEMWMGTFHSICAPILRTHAEKIGFTHNFTIYDESDSKNLIAKCMEEILPTDTGLSASQAREVISKAKNAGVTAELFDKHTGRLRTAKISAPFTEDIRKN
jgi:DNA helicase-2/ATP-dependent DNA helicase PcrA